MSKRIVIDTAIIENEELLLFADSAEAAAGLAPTGQMLVDSDHFSFIYIVEKDGSYQYVAIPEGTWLAIYEGLKKGLNTYLAAGESKIPLPGFLEEMNYLIENITGNSNYGEEMVAKVEQVFTAPSA